VGLNIQLFYSYFSFFKLDGCSVPVVSWDSIHPYPFYPLAAHLRVSVNAALSPFIVSLLFH